MTRIRPRVLKVESGALTLVDRQDGTSTRLPLAHTAHVWQRLEAALRLEIYLAWQATQVEQEYDIVWAGSEKIAIPLSFMGLRQPLVVVAHHMSSPLKAWLARLTGIVRRWAGIGFVSDESRDFLRSYFGVRSDRLFACGSAWYLEHAAALPAVAADGPIVSTGTAKRDYNTLIAALANLPGYETELYLSSRHGDQLRTSVEEAIPAWVRVMGWTSLESLLERYRRARFVAVPLHETTHSGAGFSTVMEAGAFSKPVIATRTGGMSTFVRDGETGILVPPYDMQAWQRALHTLWTQPALAQKMGAAARDHIAARFDPSTVRRGIGTFLDRLYLENPGDLSSPSRQA
jgi:glycosyltransferase involved in cell wall biosynthesis